MRKAHGTRTRTDLDWALIMQRPVTVSYVRADGAETVRTIELYDIRETKAGNIIAKAMDRETGQARTWRLDRITHYTLHRGRYTVPRPVKENAR
jgi:predicted DNA-binding transcriptional regulator YafY